MKQKKDIRITIRVSDETLDVIDEFAKLKSYTRSEAIRQLSLKNLSTSMERISKEDKNIDRILFYFEKASNHMNQVAKTLNGGITEKKLLSSLTMLIKISDSFKYGLLLCDPKQRKYNEKSNND